MKIKNFIADFFLNLRWSTIAFYMMRITGMGIAAFLIIHIFSVGQVVISEEAFDKTMAAYNNTLFRFGEYFLFLAVVFHAANGVRVILGDLFSLTEKQKALFWGAMASAFAFAVLAFFQFLGRDFGL